MKNKKMQRILALCLAAGMTVTACGGGAEEKETTAAATTKAQAAAPAATAAPADNAGSAEPTVLTVWVQENQFRDYNDNLATAYIEEKFNVDLVFEYYPMSAKRATQYSLMLAEGKYPDILLSQFTPEQISEAILADAMLDMSPYVVEGSNYYKLLQDHPELVNVVTANNGGIYSFPYITGDVRNVSEYKMWIRQEWLDALGWEKAPATPEEFKQYLIQVRDNDVNGNGDPNDEIPLMGHYGGRKSDPICFLMNPFELYTNENYYITDAGEIKFTAITDGWRKGLAYIADLYAEGLIAEETYVQDEATFKEVLFSDATIGAYPFWSSANFISRESVGCPSYFTYEALAPLKGEFQQSAAIKDGRPQLRSAISTQCSNPELAFEILDYMLSEEGAYLCIWGAPDTGWEWVDQKNLLGGDKSIKLKVDDHNYARWNNGDTGAYGTKEIRYTGVDDESQYEIDPTKNHLKAAEKYEPYYVYHNIPSLVWADDDLTLEKNEYQSLIDECVNVASTEFIMGRRDINDDKQWQAYLDELDSLGLDTYIDLLYQYYKLK